MKNLSEKKEKYLKTSYLCLNCGHPDIEGGHVNVDADCATQDIICNYCGSTWKDFYQLKDVIDIEISNDHK